MTLDDFYRQHRKKLLYFIRRKVYDYDAAEELLHEAFIKATLNPYDPTRGTTMLTWIRMIINYVLDDYYRRCGARQPVGGPLVSLEDVSKTVIKTLDATYNPERSFMTTADVKAAISGLPLTLRAVARMAFIEDLTNIEIAGIMGVERHTIQVWKEKAKCLLKEHLASYR